MKVYVTKQVCTKGITEHEVETTDHAPSMVCGVGKDIGRYWHKPYWHLTLGDAIKHADELRERKVLALQRQLAKLKQLDFTR